MRRQNDWFKMVSTLCCMILSFTGQYSNCGVCHTSVYECLGVKKERDDSKSKNSQSKLQESHYSGSIDKQPTPLWTVRSLKMTRHVLFSASKPCFVVPSLRWMMRILTRAKPQGSPISRDIASKCRKLFHCFVLWLVSNSTWKLYLQQTGRHCLHPKRLPIPSQTVFLVLHSLQSCNWDFPWNLTSPPESENVQKTSASCHQVPGKPLQ